MVPKTFIIVATFIGMAPAQAQREGAHVRDCGQHGALQCGFETHGEIPSESWPFAKLDGEAQAVTCPLESGCDHPCFVGAEPLDRAELKTGLRRRSLRNQSKLLDEFTH